MTNSDIYVCNFYKGKLSRPVLIESENTKVGVVKAVDRKQQFVHKQTLLSVSVLTILLIFMSHRFPKRMKLKKKLERPPLLTLHNIN